MTKNRPQAITDLQFTATTTAAVNCWGIFKTRQHTTPMVYCETEDVAKRIQTDKSYPHYDSRYADCAIKKISRKVNI
jgi:hypothetical protein